MTIESLIIMIVWHNIHPCCPRQLIAGGVVAEARQALTNLGGVLEAAGCSYNNVVKMTVIPISIISTISTISTMQGLTAARDIAEGEVVAFYNGVRLPYVPGERCVDI